MGLCLCVSGERVSYRVAIITYTARVVESGVLVGAWQERKLRAFSQAIKLPSSLCHLEEFIRDAMSLPTFLDINGNACSEASSRHCNNGFSPEN